MQRYKSTECVSDGSPSVSHTNNFFLDSTRPSLFPSFGLYLCVPLRPVLVTVLSVRLSLLAAAFTQGKDEDPNREPQSTCSISGPHTKSKVTCSHESRGVQRHRLGLRQGSKTWKGTGHVAVKRYKKITWSMFIFTLNQKNVILNETALSHGEYFFTFFSAFATVCGTCPGLRLLYYRVCSSCSCSYSPFSRIFVFHCSACEGEQVSVIKLWRQRSQENNARQRKGERKSSFPWTLAARADGLF